MFANSTNLTAVSETGARCCHLFPSFVSFRVARDYGIHHKVEPTGSCLRHEPQLLLYFRYRLSRETRLQFNDNTEDRNLVPFTQACGLSYLYLQHAAHYIHALSYFTFKLRPFIFINRELNAKLLHFKFFILP